MSSVLWVIFGMAVVTYLPRMLPLVLLSRLRLPPWLMHWLRFVPVAVLAALLAPGLLLAEGRLAPVNPSVLAALPTFWVAAKTRNLLITVLTGLGAMALLRLVW